MTLSFPQKPIYFTKFAVTIIRSEKMAYENSKSYNKQPKQSNDLTLLGKVQPQDTELEEAVLGALMLEKDAYSIVCDLLRPEAFYDPRNQKIYAAIVSLGSAQRPIDLLTVTEQLRTDGELDFVGGPIRISELTGRVASAAHVEFHARIIAQKFLARELIRFSSEIQEKAFDESNDVDDLLQDAEGRLFEISQRNLKKDVTIIAPVITEAIKQIEIASKRETGISGLQTGFHQLDKITSGWHNSDLIIIAARPAMGKTAFVLSMAKNMSVNYEIPTAVFSLEMSKLQLVNRLICNVCEIEGEKIKSGRLSPLEWNQINTRIDELFSAKLFIDDTASLSIFELRTKARRLVREHDVKIIIIDYLQLMNASGMKFGSREQEVSMISRSLKQLAKELNIPIIALSQLNRSVENRTDGKRPQLSDLRESGAIEQDADIVCFIHRPEYYNRSGVDANGNDIRGLAEFIIAKHRNGSVEDVKMRFVGKYARFQNWEDTHEVIQSTYESKINQDNPNDNSDFLASQAPTIEPNMDFMTSPDESPSPF